MNSMTIQLYVSSIFILTFYHENNKTAKILSFCITTSQGGEDLMTITTLRNRVPVSVGIPFYILELLDKKVIELNCKSRSDLIVKIIQEKFNLPNK